MCERVKPTKFTFVKGVGLTPYAFIFSNLPQTPLLNITRILFPQLIRDRLDLRICERL